MSFGSWYSSCVGWTRIDQVGSESNATSRDAFPVLQSESFFGQLIGGPAVIQMFNVLILETEIGPLEPFDIFIREFSVLLCIPGRAQSEIADQFQRVILLKGRCHQRGETLFRLLEMGGRIRDIEEAKIAQVTEERRIGVKVVAKARQPCFSRVHVRQGESGRAGTL